MNKKDIHSAAQALGKLAIPAFANCNWNIGKRDGHVIRRSRPLSRTSITQPDATNMSYDFFYSEGQQREEMDFHPSSLAEWDKFDAELGAYNWGDCNSAWLLSDRDCWYPNPFYIGPPCPHPESYESDEEYEAECARLDGGVQPRMAAVPAEQW